MAGQQHPFLSGFPNVQQSAMRTQFGGGQMVSGLMGPQQGNMVSSQQFGMGVGVGGVGNVGANAMGMPNTQQVLAQQQQQQQSMAMQQQMQQMQQQQLQLQQQQQAAMVQQNQINNQATTSQTPVPPTQPPRQQQNKEFNTASLCRFGQETVQEIVSRALELFQTLKVLQPPNGTAQGANMANEKKKKVYEQLEMMFKVMFKRLRLIYEKCNENCQLQGMEYTHIESLIPLKEEWDMKSDEKKTSEAYRLTCEERKEIMEQVILKNRHIKEIIDHLRRIISEINTMLNMRRS